VARVGDADGGDGDDTAVAMDAFHWQHAYVELTARWCRARGCGRLLLQTR
jgi:hypothetical protein